MTAICCVCSKEVSGNCQVCNGTSPHYFHEDCYEKHMNPMNLCPQEHPEGPAPSTKMSYIAKEQIPREIQRSDERKQLSDEAAWIEKTYKLYSPMQRLVAAFKHDQRQTPKRFPHGWYSNCLSSNDIIGMLVLDIESAQILDPRPGEEGRYIKGFRLMTPDEFLCCLSFNVPNPFKEPPRSDEIGYGQYMQNYQEIYPCMLVHEAVSSHNAHIITNQVASNLWYSIKRHFLDYKPAPLPPVQSNIRVQFLQLVDVYAECQALLAKIDRKKRNIFEPKFWEKEMANDPKGLAVVAEESLSDLVLRFQEHCPLALKQRAPKATKSNPRRIQREEKEKEEQTDKEADEEQDDNDEIVDGEASDKEQYERQEYLDETPGETAERWMNPRSPPEETQRQVTPAPKPKNIVKSKPKSKPEPAAFPLPDPPKQSKKRARPDRDHSAESKEPAVKKIKSKPAEQHVHVPQPAVEAVKAPARARPYNKFTHCRGGPKTCNHAPLAAYPNGELKMKCEFCLAKDNNRPKKDDIIAAQKAREAAAALQKSSTPAVIPVAEKVGVNLDVNEPAG